MIRRLLAALRPAPDPIDDLIARAGVNRRGTGRRRLWPHPKPGTRAEGWGLRPLGHAARHAQVAARLNLGQDKEAA